MKTIKSFVGLAFVLFASFFVVSCNDDVKETLEQQWALVLDNHDSNYDYSDDGKCFGDGGGISKENLSDCWSWLEALRHMGNRQEWQKTASRILSQHNWCISR